MGILEQVAGLKEKGVSEEEIVQKLRGDGISPNEISEALSQAKIKSAVSSEQEGGQSKEGMQPSIMGPEKLDNSEGDEGPVSLPTENVSDEDLTPPSPSGFSPHEQQGMNRGFMPMTKEFSEQQDQGYSGGYIPQQGPQSQGTYQEQYSPQYQEQQGYDESQYYNQSGDADTMIEISEQVFAEKIKNVQKQMENFNEFKGLAEVKIDNISDRLKRIESSIDRLQAEILEKVGSYGRGLEGVKKELGMMQESFGKVVNTLADKAEKKHHTHTTHNHPHTSHTKKKSKTKSRSKK